MIITNNGVTWTHGQVLDTLSTFLRELALALATEAPTTAAPAVTAATDMLGTIRGLSAGVDALELLVADQREQIVTLRTQLAGARADPPDTVPATIRRIRRDANDKTIETIMETREMVPRSALTPIGAA